jgi:hypothetical protein
MVKFIMQKGASDNNDLIIMQIAINTIEMTREKNGNGLEVVALYGRMDTLCKVPLFDEISGDNFMFELSKRIR